MHYSIILRACFIGVLAFLFTSDLIATISLLGSRADNTAVAASIGADIENGSVTFPRTWDRNVKTGIDTWTDCLVIEIATFGEKDPVSVMTRSNYVRFVGPQAGMHPCELLRVKIGVIQTGQNITTSDYWRYWWGSAALLNIGMGIAGLSLPRYQGALKATTYLLILLVGCLAFWRYRRAAWPLVPILLALTFAFALPLLGQSIAHAPGLLFGLLFIAIYIAFGLDRAAVRWQFFYLFAAGGMGFYLDLMNGDLPTILIGFALVRLVAFIASNDLHSGTPASRYAATIAVAQAAFAYIAGAVSMAMLRIGLRAALTEHGLGELLSEWQDKLAKHTNAGWSEQHLELQHWNLQEIFAHIYSYFDIATFPHLGKIGVTVLYILGVLSYIALFLWFYIHRKQMQLELQDRLIAATLIAAIVPIWMLAFPIHAIIHFWMMGRLFSLFFAMSASIAIIAHVPPPRILRRFVKIGAIIHDAVGKRPDKI